MEAAMLQCHPLREHAPDAARMVELLQLAKQTLLDHGMADMDEYGDMLKWGLPKQEGFCRNIHVFHPDWCSFSDQYRGTIHYHAGEIRGTVLIGSMEHATYRATADPDGDRELAGQRYSLQRNARLQTAGTAYSLGAYTPHWLVPKELTLTYFEEEDGDMGDLLEPVVGGHDEHRWDQADAEALMPELLARIDAEIDRLTVLA